MAAAKEEEAADTPKGMLRRWTAEMVWREGARELRLRSRSFWRGPRQSQHSMSECVPETQTSSSGDTQTLSTGSRALQSSVDSQLLKSVQNTCLSRPPDHTLLSPGSEAMLQTESVCAAMVCMQRCEPRSHSFIVASEDPGAQSARASKRAKHTHRGRGGTGGREGG
eukprot:538863-Rhodomonas_salina.1